MAKKRMTIEDLAEIIERTVAKKEDMSAVKERLDRVEKDLVDIKSDTAYLKARVSEIGNQEIEQL